MSKRIEIIKTVKGMRDLLPKELYLWRRVEDDVHRVFGAYGFQEIRTPVVEETALFARSVGADTDIVTKEMYTFQDRERDSLTLRPEATASVVRAYIEHGMFNEGRIHKLYYLGPMFRRERPQKGRYRQFFQIGAEVLGSDHPAVDAEVIEMLVVFLKQAGGAGIGDFALYVNSVGCARCRAEYLKILRAALQGVKASLCADCQRRSETNPLRVLDCKVEADQSTIENLPRILDHLCPECRQHFESVTAELNNRSIAYTINSRLVRGLDYYTRTTFEITSGALGAQDAVLGGGRYDGLSEMLGGPPAPGIGFAIGQDRLMLAVSEHAQGLAGESAGQGWPLDAYIAWLGPDAQEPATRLARQLRERDLKVAMDFEPTKLKKSLGMANRLGACFAVIIGEAELAAGRYQVKDLRAGEQQEMEPANIADYVKEQIRK
jgi:histidyl-tRNA synthetase